MMNKTQFDREVGILLEKHLIIYRDALIKYGRTENIRVKIVVVWKFLNYLRKVDYCPESLVVELRIFRKMRQALIDKNEDREYLRNLVLDGLEKGYEYYKASQLL